MEVTKSAAGANVSDSSKSRIGFFMDAMDDPTSLRRAMQRENQLTESGSVPQA
jgi:hypothetical protein